MVSFLNLQLPLNGQEISEGWLLLVYWWFMRNRENIF